MPFFEPLAISIGLQWEGIGDREPVWGQRDEITGAPRPVGGTTQSTTAEGARSQAASRGQDAEPSAQSALL